MKALGEANGFDADDSDNDIEGLGLPEGISRSNDRDIDDEENDPSVIKDEAQIQASAAEDFQA